MLFRSRVSPDPIIPIVYIQLLYCILIPIALAVPRRTNLLTCYTFLHISYTSLKNSHNQEKRNIKFQIPFQKHKVGFPFCILYRWSKWTFLILWFISMFNVGIRGHAVTTGEMYFTSRDQLGLPEPVAYYKNDSWQWFMAKNRYVVQNDWLCWH